MTARPARFTISLLGALLLLPGAAPAGKPQRIVSLNLCADQYLLALADPGQIAALTRFSVDPEMSAAAASARRFRSINGSAEEVLALRPDLIIAMPGRRQETMARLRGRTIATLDLPSADSYAAIREQVRAVAAAIGHPERGAALLARMDAELAGVASDSGGGQVAGYYQRRGFLTGTGTLIDDLMHRVGLRNLAARLNKPPLSRVSLEEMALAQPDFLIVETATDRITDRGAELLHHPLIGKIRRLRLPQAWTVCGGPAYVRAARSLAEQLRRARPKSVRARE